MKLYEPFDGAEAGYIIEQRDDVWGWSYTEPGEDDDLSEPFERESEAFRDAARDWDENGGIAGSRLSATLKARATALEKAGR